MAEPIIKIVNLDKTFKTPNGDLKVLSSVNLEIGKGEIFGIIGMSGAGKSTLVRCINYLEKPTSGDVVFDGCEMGKMNSRQLSDARRQMGMIFQQFNLLMQRNVISNVCFPLEISKVPHREAKKRAEELLEIVGLADKAMSYPSQLSGGQKQRVAIARALATNPKVLLCDEATSALDPATTRSILELLKDINKKMGITIVVITHEMSVVEDICSRVAIISESRIVETGTVEEIFTSPKTEIAKSIVFPEKKKIGNFENAGCIRIIFDGRSSYEPVIANMILECKETVNIIFADTKNIEGRAVGEMVIQLPENENSARKIIGYLNARNIRFEEVGKYV